MTTRFAPSPTGFLHIGGLRTALYSYLQARHCGGKFLLRIEDTDLKRNSQEATKAILEAFKWVGLEHEGSIEYQSQRGEIYKKYIDKLLDEGKAYKCYLSREELDKLRASQIEQKIRPHYDGRYRDFTGTPPVGIQPVIRIKAPQDGEISFNDGIKGKLSFNVKDMLDDFIIARADGSPTYNFVVTVDDALMGVSDVIRGDDHVSNTPKQIVLYEALGFKIPNFYHVPMIHNEEGKKLSKRDGAMDVMDYKRLGFLPQALLNFLLRLGWGHGDREIFSLEEMIEFFDAKNVSASASNFNYEKLLWLNHHYMLQTPICELENLLCSLGGEKITNEQKDLLFSQCLQRSKTLIELQNEIDLILKDPEEYEQKSFEKLSKNMPILAGYLEKLQKSQDENYEDLALRYLEENGLKLGSLAQLLRLAFVGKMSGPGVFDMMKIIGKDQSIKRIENLCKREKS